MTTTDRLKNILDVIEASAKATSDMAAEQLPLVVQEIVDWHFTYGIISASACALGILILVVLYWLVWRATENHFEPGLPRTFCGVFAVMLVMLLTAFVVAGVMCSIKAVSAPRVVVIEYVRGLR